MTLPPPTISAAQFAPPSARPLRFTIASRSSAVRVVATQGVEPTAQGATLRRELDGSITVDSSRSSGSEIVLSCPAQSDLSVGTASGRVDISGVMGRVHVVTASGRIDIERAAAIDARTNSAGIHIEHCDGDCRVTTKSGAVHITHAGNVDISAVSGKVIVDEVTDSVVRTMSGVVSLGAGRGSKVQVRTMSGSVDIDLPTGASPDINLRSLSGKVDCECRDGDDGALDIQSTSGSIRVRVR